MKAGVWTLTLFLLATAPGTAADLNLLCAVVDAEQCPSKGACNTVDTDEMNFPRFFVVDFGAGQLHGKRPDGSEASSAIRSRFRQDDRAMLQGVENGRAWSLVIADEGAFVLSAADIGASFAIFGHCINEGSQK